MAQVWETLFDQAKEFTNIFVDPHTPGHARVLQHIAQHDIMKLKALWSDESGTLSLDNVVALFFPKSNRNQRIHRSFLSHVTGTRYTHSVRMLTTMAARDYTTMFDCLAKYAIDRTPLPPSVHWDLLTKLANGSGLLTNDVLRHVLFWFGGLETAEDGTPLNSWVDRLSAGPFATRASVNGGVSMCADKSSGEAARIFVQALFDKIRGADDIEHDWENEAAKQLVRIPLFCEISMLTSEGQANPQRILSERKSPCRGPSACVLPGPVPKSCLEQGCCSRQELRRLSISRSDGGLQ